MARYAVTGGAGFIGSNLTEALLRAGHGVRVLDDFSSGRRSNLERAVEWATAAGGQYEEVEGDVRDPGTCRRALEGVDYVLHQAAIPSVQRSVEDPVVTNEVNVKGTLNLLEAARRHGVRRFVFASSCAVYGESPTLPKLETMPSDPVSPYALQKLTAESYCGLYHRLYGLPTVGLRYFNVFGPRQSPESDYAAVVPRFIAAARGGGRPTVYGDGEQTRDFIYVDNVVQANVLACDAGAAAWGRAFNVGSGERVSLNALLALLGKLVGRPLTPDHLPPRPGDIRHSLAGIERTTSALGYRVEIDLAEGLRRTLEST